MQSTSNRDPELQIQLESLVNIHFLFKLANHTVTLTIAIEAMLDK